MKLKKERTIPAGDLKERESRLKYLQKVRGIGLIAGEPGCGISSLYYERHVTPVIILDEIHLVTTCLIIAGGKKQRQVDEDVVYQAQQELEILPLRVPYF